MYLAWTFKIICGPNGNTNNNKTKPTNYCVPNADDMWPRHLMVEIWKLTMWPSLLRDQRLPSTLPVTGCRGSVTTLWRMEVFFPWAGVSAVFTRCFFSLLPGRNWEAGLPPLLASVFWWAMWDDISLWVFCSARNPRHAGTRGKQDSTCHSTAHYPDKK